ncbi:hypothetical protein CCP2SC5_1030006 [Azospirillaceae bacterium]
MICDQCRKLLPGLIDDELDSQDRQDVERHLVDCVMCSILRMRVVALRKVIRWNAKRYDASPGMAERIWSSVLSREIDDSELKPRAQEERRSPRYEEKQESRSFFRWGGLGAGIGFLLIAVIVWFGLSLLSSSSEEDKIFDSIAARHLASLVENKIVHFEAMERHEIEKWFLSLSAFLPPLGVMESQEFPLVGGRLDEVNGATASVVVFRRETTPISLTYLPGQMMTNQKVEDRQRGSIVLMAWRQGEGSWWVASTLGKARLESFVRLVRVMSLN